MVGICVGYGPDSDFFGNILDGERDRCCEFLRLQELGRESRLLLISARNEFFTAPTYLFSYFGSFRQGGRVFDPHPPALTLNEFM